MRLLPDGVARAMETTPAVELSDAESRSRRLRLREVVEVPVLAKGGRGDDDECRRRIAAD